jgi:hypothetical protein
VTASQCWLYFDTERALDEVRRVSAAGARLMTCHLCWLPRLDEIARRSEALVLAHNPHWTGADWPGLIAAKPAWTPDDFRFLGNLEYDEGLPFTRESWRGRMRASRGVGASMSAQEVARFDAEHAVLLDKIAPEAFQVLHRIDAHLLLTGLSTGRSTGSSPGASAAD